MDAMIPYIAKGCDYFHTKAKLTCMLVRNVVARTSKEDAMVPYIDEGYDCFEGGCNGSTY